MMNHATFKASLFMAAGIIDHETGTRDMRRLGGLFRYMPITATLAMVASAAMAGVPLLNGFLSKEMFFAEAIETHVRFGARHLAALCRGPGQRLRRHLFAALHPLRVLRTAAGRSAARTARAAVLDARCRSMFLVLACLVVGIVPALTVGPYPPHRRGVGAGPDDAGVQPGGLARLQPAADHERGGARWRCHALSGAQGLSAHSPDGPPLLRPPQGPAHLRARRGRAVPGDGPGPPRRCSARAACSRNCGSCSWRPSSRRWFRSISAASACRWPSSDVVDPALALVWLIGVGCAHRRRLAGQVSPAGRAHPAGRRRTGHLHHLRLVLRARSGADPARSSRS